MSELQSLCERAPELARSWAILQIEAHEPSLMAEVPTAAIAERGPRLIAVLAAALAREQEPERLAWAAACAGGDSEAGCEPLWPANDPAGAVMAAEALRAVLRQAIWRELGEGRTAELAEIWERLACACSALAASWIRTRHEALSAHRAGSPGSPEGGGALVVDEHQEAQLRAIEIRDVRGRSSRESWLEEIEARVQRFERDRQAFAVLLGDVAFEEPLQGGADAGSGPLAWGSVTAALRRELGPMDWLSQERPGRYWMVVPEADAVGARLLAERLGRALGASLGAPLSVAVGIALCPDHGCDAATLRAHATIDLHAARAAGRLIAPADEQAG